MADLHTQLCHVLSHFEASVYRNTSGYNAKYFPDRGRATLATVEEITVNPTTKLLKWLDDLRDEQSDAGRNEFVLGSIKCGPGSITLCLVEASNSKVDRNPSHAAILVLGLVETGPEDSPTDVAILRLFALASDVFATRPDRRFLHAFHIYNTKMEAWTFDRAGAYSCEAFDILADPHHFTNIFATYMSMSREKLGLNPLYKEDGHGACFKLQASDHFQNKIFHVEKEAFVRQDNIVGSGTTCFEAHTTDSSSQKVVVKFTWSPPGDFSELRLLQSVSKKNVLGVPRLEGFCELGDIASLRQGLIFDQPYRLSIPTQVKELDDDEATVHSSGPIKYVGDSSFENLILRCIVTSPFGRPLDSFSTLSELLITLRDIVKSLRSLYLDANILHRDVSTQNIMIGPTSHLTGASTGLLIDLNLALDLQKTTVERLLIGSEGFMAVGILGGDDHTYRHDLESVFYVFLWMAICHDGITSQNVPKSSRLNNWRGTDFLKSFHNKMHDMKREEFETLIHDEFTQPFRSLLPLGTLLHELLFPLRNGRIFIGTDVAPDSVRKLYAGMIALFEQYMLE